MQGLLRSMYSSIIICTLRLFSRGKHLQCWCHTFILDLLFKAFNLSKMKTTIKIGKKKNCMCSYFDALFQKPSLVMKISSFKTHINTPEVWISSRSDGSRVLGLNLYISSFCLYCLLREHFEHFSSGRGSSLLRVKQCKGIQQRLNFYVTLSAGLHRNAFNFLHLRRNQPKA